MLPGHAKIVKCPHCGDVKKLMTLISGNTFGAEYWSDLKRIAPMLPTVSPVQKCHHCGKYYIEYNQPSEKGEDTSFERGELTYDEWKEAYLQLSNEELDDEDAMNLSLWMIHAYNDHYYREKKREKPSDSDFALFKSNVNKFISRLGDSPGKAELLREIGELDSCIETLEKMKNSDAYSEWDDFNKKIIDIIEQKAKNGDTCVFLIEFD